MSRGLAPLDRTLGVCVLLIIMSCFFRAAWRVGGPRVRDGDGPPHTTRGRGPALGGSGLLDFTIHALHTTYRAPKGLQRPLSSVLGPGGPTSKRGAAGSPTTRRPNLEQGPSHAPAQPRCSTAGGRRELLCSAMLQPHAPAWQPLKVDSKAASDSHLPPRECSLGSGCAMDESQGVSTQSSTLRARGRAGKLTQVSFAVAQHGAAVPGCVRARS